MHLNTVEQNPVLTNGRMDHIECDLIQRSNERDSSFPINYINELMENYRELRQKSSDAGPIWGALQMAQKPFWRHDIRLAPQACILIKQYVL